MPNTTPLRFAADGGLFSISIHILSYDLDHRSFYRRQVTSSFHTTKTYIGPEAETSTLSELVVGSTVHPINSVEFVTS
jgi:hypothetical protein